MSRNNYNNNQNRGNFNRNNQSNQNTNQNNNRNGGNYQQNNQNQSNHNVEKSQAQNTVPNIKNPGMLFRFEIPTSNGGLVSVGHNNAVDALAAYSCLVTLSKATSCGICNI